MGLQKGDVATLQRIYHQGYKDGQAAMLGLLIAYFEHNDPYIAKCLKDAEADIKSSLIGGKIDG